MDIKKLAMLDALRESLGIVTAACKTIDIHRSTHYVWLATDAEYQLQVEDMTEVALDFVEGKLYELINGVTLISAKERTYQLPPNIRAVMFYLKTKGKKRGYVEKPEKENAAEKKEAKKIQDEEAERLRIKEIMESPETLRFIKNWGPPEEDEMIVESTAANSNPSAVSPSHQAEAQEQPGQPQVIIDPSNDTQPGTTYESLAMDGLPPNGNPRPAVEPNVPPTSIRIDNSPDNPDRLRSSDL